MKTRQAPYFPQRNENKHEHADDTRFCGPCFLNSSLLFITTQWATSLMLVALLVALLYYLVR